jgi:ribosomal protein S18 acetylase RimI-like enzyme
MIRKLDLEDECTIKRILELQTDSYKIEAALIGFYEIPPLKDTIVSLKECGETFYGYFAEEVLAGIISYKNIDKVLDIHRVAIHPCFFRMGIAEKLIDFVEGIESGISKVIVGTGKKNMPAVSLYLKKGYKRVKDVEVSNGIHITEFEKIL